MTTLLVTVLLIVTAPSMADALVRLMLAVVSRRRESPEPAHAIGPCLIIVPSRLEGEAVRGTLQSVRSAMRDGDAAILLLDGADAVATSIAISLGIDTIEKEPAGPTKSAALAWIAAHDRERILAFDSVIIVDVGSRLPAQFLSLLRRPAGVDAVQARLCGEGSGVGEAAASSERRAQRFEDAGRMALGWNVHLRGTGAVIASAAFVDLAPRLRTKVDDWEMTLLLASAGKRTALGGVEATVTDLKPADVATAAAQRSRWLIGQLSLPFTHPGEIARLILRRPVEGTALFLEIFSRPRAAMVIVRFAAGSFILTASRSPLFAALGGLLVFTVVADVVQFVACREGRFRGVALILGAWARAIVLLPSSATQWLKARRP